MIYDRLKQSKEHKQLQNPKIIITFFLRKFIEL